MASDDSWRKIFESYGIDEHDFADSPFLLSARQIKEACQGFTKTGEKEVRILCTQTFREQRPKIFQENGLFLLPVRNGEYAIIKGDGYVDIPAIESKARTYSSKLGFSPDTSLVGNSEMQHLDYAYAASLIRSFMDDDTFVLTIRGRKRTPEFSFSVGEYNHILEVKGVQTEVDAGYESKEKILLVEAKNSHTDNVIVRQMYYPFRQWQQHTDKPIHSIFFEKRELGYCIWRFVFDDVNNYNSIRFIDSARYTISD